MSLTLEATAQYKAASDHWGVASKAAADGVDGPDLADAWVRLRDTHQSLLTSHESDMEMAKKSLHNLLRKS